MTDSGSRTLRGGRLVLVLLVAVGIVLIAGRFLVGLYVDTLWFQEVGFASIFWKRLRWVWGTRFLAGVAVAAAVYFNLRYAARTLGGIQIKRRVGNLELSEQLPRTYVTLGVLGLSALLGLWFGGSVPEDTAIHVLLAVQGVQWDLVEPILGRDASFYVFQLPLYRTAVAFLLIVTFLVFTASTGAYAATGALRWGKERLVIGNQPRIHLGACVAFFILLLAVRFWLGRSMLLQYGHSEVQGIFGYADAVARLPGLRALALLTGVSAGLVLLGAVKNRLVPAVGGLGLVLVGGLVLTRFYPAMVQSFRVEPNELERETPYIEHNLAFTRHGFGLTTMARDRFAYDGQEVPDWSAAQEQLDGLPAWTSQTLLTTFQELEARFPYYDFGTVAIDRYDGAQEGEVVALSVRELDPAGIQEPNWQNLHVRERYVTGMGAVAAAVTGRTAQGRPPMYLYAIPPEFAGAGAPEGLRLERPSVFVGSRRQLHAIINPSDSTFLAADGARGVAGTDYPVGIQLSSFLRTVALAWTFQDYNLLFAEDVTSSSRFVMRRQVLERARAVTSTFLRYPEAPYPVIHEGRIFWILEGFTSTRAFPLSSPRDTPFGRASSYVRNSVKIAVDATTGEMAFYALPERDPLLEAFRSAFPGVVRPFSEMPEGLRRHVRYSRQLLQLQASVLLQYHQDSAPAFHGQQDVWALANEQSQTTTPVPYQPEYGRYSLPGESEEEFHLTTAFVPQGRQNLTAILAGRLDPDGRRELFLYDVPVEEQVPGPRQVEALVEQDPDISQQFSLWRTGGSRVWTGHLHLVPLGARILYMEAVFLAAEADAIPELRRFVVSDGRRVAMEPSLAEALMALGGTSSLTGAVGPAGTESGEGRSVTALDLSAWPAEALDLLDTAEARLREGDWEGFGQALEELRALLEQFSGEGGGR